MKGPGSLITGLPSRIRIESYTNPQGPHQEAACVWVSVGGIECFNPATMNSRSVKAVENQRLPNQEKIPDLVFTFPSHILDFSFRARWLVSVWKTLLLPEN